MNRPRVALVLILLAAVTLTAEGVIHDSHAHENGSLTTTCAVCHNLFFGVEASETQTSGGLLPPALAAHIPDGPTVCSCDHARSDDSRAPPSLA